MQVRYQAALRPDKVISLSWRNISALPRSRKLVVGPQVVKINSSRLSKMSVRDRFQCKGVELFEPSVHDAERAA